MKRIPKRFEGEITERQAKRLRETRDCPDAECSGVLDRVDVWVDGDLIHEKYVHKGGDDECRCVGPSNGLASLTADIVASHNESGRSKGAGCLKGELR